MEALLKALGSALLPELIKLVRNNKHLIIDFLREEAKKSDNKLDDFVVGVIEDWL